MSRRAPTPISAARLEQLALGYVARFATSAAKLESYLLRKLAARGWDGGADRDDAGDDPAIGAAAGRAAVAALVARFVAAGYVDDQGFARSRSGTLQRRGLGGRRIAQALGQAGIAVEVVAAALPGEAAARAAALALARRRRLGPFGPGGLDRKARDKQLAVLLRGGHPLDSARELVNAVSIAAAEEWAREMDEG